MGRSGRRARVSIAAALIVGVVAVVSIAVASQADTPRRIEVSSPASGGGTSTSAADVIVTDTTSTMDTTTDTGTTTTDTGTITTPTQLETTAQPSTSTSTAGIAVTSPLTSEPTTAPLVAGTYVGVEHFALFTGRCAFLDHHIVGGFSASDGTTWTFHQDYCGTLQGDLWSGAGTFALTATDGATITGTVTETNIKVPSPGVPYTLAVTGGTQRFAGATGACRLDNHLHQIQFGLQDDYGSFACNVAV